MGYVCYLPLYLEILDCSFHLLSRKLVKGNYQGKACGKGLPIYLDYSILTRRQIRGCTRQDPEAYTDKNRVILYNYKF